MSGDPYFNNVSLLLHCDGANGSTTFADSGPNNRTVTAGGNAHISTAQSQWGGASAAFDGNGDYLQASSSEFAFGVSDYTVEFWLCNASGYSAAYKTYAAVWQSANYAWIIQANNSNFGMSWGDGDSYKGTLNAAWTPGSAGVWEHFAFTRSGTTLRIFRGGVKIAEGTQSTNLAAPTNPKLSIGLNPDGNIQPFDGYLDDIRITLGVARYTAAFTPPSAPFDDTGFHPAIQLYGLIAELLHAPAPPALQLHGLMAELLHVPTYHISGNVSVVPDTAAHEKDWKIAAYTASDTTIEKVIGDTGTDYYIGLLTSGPYFIVGVPNIGSKWGPGSTVQVGDKCFSSTPQTIPYIFKATSVSGVTGSTEPDWNTTIGETTIDGGVTWTNIGKMLRPVMVGPLFAVTP